MRLTSALFGLSCIALISFSEGAIAQDQANDPAADPAAPQAPAGQTRQFGPRAGKQQGAAGQQVLPTETIGKFGAWEVQCAQGPKNQDGTDGAKNCGMIQNAKHESNQNVGISVIVSKLKRGDKTAVMMRVMAPIGVYLPTGIPVEIDGAALPNRLTFTRCLPRVCEGFGEASPESLSKFLKGGVATFYLYDRPGNGYPLKIDLQGFAKALGELDKL